MVEAQPDYALASITESILAVLVWHGHGQLMASTEIPVGLGLVVGGPPVTWLNVGAGLALVIRRQMVAWESSGPMPPLSLCRDR